MFEGILNLSDPSKNSYYYPILLGIATILLLIQLIILILKDYQKKKNPGVNLNQSLDMGKMVLIHIMSVMILVLKKAILSS